MSESLGKGCRPNRRFKVELAFLKSRLERLEAKNAALKARAEAAEAELPERNKWAMLCAHFGYDAKNSCTATLINRLEKAEARLAILDAQDVGLPPHGDRCGSGCACRNYQLLDALRAVKAWQDVARRFRETDPEGPTAACDANCTIEDCPFKAYDALAGKNG